MLERAGATAVVPEILEPSLQLAAAVLSELNLHEDDVAETIRAFRRNHLAELQLLAQVGPAPRAACGLPVLPLAARAAGPPGQASFFPGPCG